MKQITIKDIVEVYENDFLANSSKWGELVLSPAAQLEYTIFNFYTPEGKPEPKTRNTIRTMYRMAMAKIKQLNAQNKALKKILL